jgi:hypothetical protein
MLILKARYEGDSKQFRLHLSNQPMLTIEYDDRKSHYLLDMLLSVLKLSTVAHQPVPILQSWMMPIRI